MCTFGVLGLSCETPAARKWIVMKLNFSMKVVLMNLYFTRHDGPSQIECHTDADWAGHVANTNLQKQLEC